MRFAVGGQYNVDMYARKLFEQSRQTEPVEQGVKFAKGSMTQHHTGVHNQPDDMPADALFPVMTAPFLDTGSVAQGGLRTKVASLLEIRGDAVMNRDTAYDKGDEDEFEEMEARIYFVRKPHVKISDEISSMIAMSFDTQRIKSQSRRLMDWYVRYDSRYGIRQAVYWKFGLPATHGVHGLGATQHAHPWLYCAGLSSGIGDGNVFADYSATPATYIASCAVNIARVQAGQDGSDMSLDMIDRLLQHVRRIEDPFVGKPYKFIFFMHTDQESQLLANSTVKGLYKNWASKKADFSDVWMKFASFMYKNVLFIKDDVLGQDIYPYELADLSNDVTDDPASADKFVVGPYQNPGGGTNGVELANLDLTNSRIWEPANVNNDTYNVDRKVGLLCGRNVVYNISPNGGPTFAKDMEWDFGMTKKSCLKAWGGWSRPDFVPNADSLADANRPRTNSIAVVTWSPRDNGFGQ